MDLYGEILAKALAGHGVRIEIVGADPQQIVQDACYQALARIKAALENGALSDAECFAAIEEIVGTFEDLGCGVRERHDFG